MDAIAYVENEAHVVIDKEHADTAIAHKSDVVGELADLTLIEPGGRLVEKHIGRIGRQGASHAHSALNSVRKCGCGSVGPLPEVELLNEAVGSFASGL